MFCFRSRAHDHSTGVTVNHIDLIAGFDPWDVSQQGLADLLETEAEQKQGKPHPLEGGANMKKTLNGFRPYTDAHHKPPSSSLYRNWQDIAPPPSSSSSSVNTSSSSGGDSEPTPMGGGGAGGGVMGGNVAFGSNASDSLQDEFRALFPNVNISFGGTMYELYV